MNFTLSSPYFADYTGTMELEHIAPRYYRQPHDLEIVDYGATIKDFGRVYLGDGIHTGPVRSVVLENNKGYPEVYRLRPSHSFTITDPWKDLVAAMNPKLSPAKALSVYLKGLMLCNTADYLCDDIRICGGALLRPDRIEDGIFYAESLLINEPVPTADYVLANPHLWYYGMTIIPDGRRNFITRLGTDGQYHPVRIPFVSRLPIAIPLNWLDELPPDFDPATYDARMLM